MKQHFLLPAFPGSLRFPAALLIPSLFFLSSPALKAGMEIPEGKTPESVIDALSAAEAAQNLTAGAVTADFKLGDALCRGFRISPKARQKAEELIEAFHRKLCAGELERMRQILSGSESVAFEIAPAPSRMEAEMEAMWREVEALTGPEAGRHVRRGRDLNTNFQDRIRCARRLLLMKRESGGEDGSRKRVEWELLEQYALPAEKNGGTERIIRSASAALREIPLAYRHLFETGALQRD